MLCATRWSVHNASPDSYLDVSALPKQCKEGLFSPGTLAFMNPIGIRLHIFSSPPTRYCI